ncbi:D-serine deaminase, pyridoxal phosphate-dependent [Sphingopyxis sp. YR583]|jgi:D-serine deaminase-like pyridoxal phosphate-dependent protein|uniref:alanine racemase n=1 Tax=Sphingopyxis sp. YR583 TaxID=1881047 RepID=UPI0008A7C82D|nr:alanine racemase [Sphingopyxis sp. YR583]SEH19893.1 D-serine deaminase, pyridoxal phosphate-dependent [Sphingopyxis sp. YR583]
MFERLDTPRLILDSARLTRNADRMRARCADLGVILRPHLKTAKSANVARIAAGGERGPITVSTLAEAEYFAAAGWRDILYSTAIAPGKLARAHRIQHETGARLLFVVDDHDAAALIGQTAAALDARFGVLIEVDCGEHRSGVEPASPALLKVADAIASAAPYLELMGIMSHAGHSYAFAESEPVRALAEIERFAAVSSADYLRERGYPCPIVSIGSTPTVLFAGHLEGVTEVRAGIYLFHDLAQLSRGVCTQEDIAVSVLATVIGHQRNGPSLILDAGALALSKDVGANRFLPEAGYGLVCDAVTLEPLGSLAVTVVHQEHGNVPVPDDSWFARLPIGSLVRILPNHACLTCAAYTSYDVLQAGEIIAKWPRTGGW